MLDYFTAAINIDTESINWIDVRRQSCGSANDFWRSHCMQNIYTYLELIETEPDYPAYDY